jgi:hypothetical protein
VDTWIAARLHVGFLVHDCGRAIGAGEIVFGADTSTESIVAASIVNAADRMGWDGMTSVEQSTSGRHWCVDGTVNENGNRKSTNIVNGMNELISVTTRGEWL